MHLLVHDNGRGLGRHNGVNTWVFHHQENKTNSTIQFLHRDKAKHPDTCQTIASHTRNDNKGRVRMSRGVEAGSSQSV